MINSFKILLSIGLVLLTPLEGCSQSNEKAIQFIETTYKRYLMSMDDVKSIDDVIKKTSSNKFRKRIYGVPWGREMFICTQDPYEEWGDMIHVSPYYREKDTYILSFYDKKLYPNAHKLKIKLIFEKGESKIDDINCISVE